MPSHTAETLRRHTYRQAEAWPYRMRYEHSYTKMDKIAFMANGTRLLYVNIKLRQPKLELDPLQPLAQLITLSAMHGYSE